MTRKPSPELGECSAGPPLPFTTGTHTVDPILDVPSWFAMIAPALCPTRLDPKRHLITFVHFSKDVQRRAAFLEPSLALPLRAEDESQAYTFNVDDLLLDRAQEPSLRGPVHFILISGFCNSTLLARYLDLIPSCFVLKEPPLLSQLAMLRVGWSALATAGATSEIDWQQLADLSLSLLSRRFLGTETVIVKAADLYSPIGDALLRRSRKTKLLLLSADLRTFILSVLKSPGRRAWMRAPVGFWKRAVDSFPVLARVDTERLDDATASAYAWLATETFFRKLQMKGDPDRLRCVDAEEISNSPVEALRKVSKFFDLDVDDRTLRLIPTSEAARRHSKDPSVRYDATSRRQALAAAAESFGQEADPAIAWAASLREELERDLLPSGVSRRPAGVWRKLHTDRSRDPAFAVGVPRDNPRSTRGVRLYGVRSPFFLENEFYDRAEELRRQFEDSVVAAQGRQLDLLGQVFAAKTYRFMAVGANQVFDETILLELLDKLRTWAQVSLSAGHATTPQLEVYVGESWRRPVADPVCAEWHYILRLTPGNIMGIKLQRYSRVDLRRVLTREVNVPLGFNQLLVHRTRTRYAIDMDPAASPDPLTGRVLLHGHMW